VRRFLALDQSLSSCGFALWDEGDPLPLSGSWKLADGIHNRPLAFIGLHREIGRIDRERKITILAHETPILTGRDKVPKLIALYGLVAHIESIGHIRNIATVSVDAFDWRTTFLGPSKERKGASPFQLKRWAEQRCEQLGIAVDGHDQAEAVAILDHLLHEQRIMPPWRIANPFLPPLGS